MLFSVIVIVVVVVFVDYLGRQPGGVGSRHDSWRLNSKRSESESEVSTSTRAFVSHGRLSQLIVLGKERFGVHKLSMSEKSRHEVWARWSSVFESSMATALSRKVMTQSGLVKESQTLLKSVSVRSGTNKGTIGMQGTKDTYVSP